MTKKRQRKDDGSSKDAEATEAHSQKQLPTRRREYDPDGTLDVARDTIHEGDDDDPNIQLLENFTEEQKKQVGKQLFGSQGDLTLQRRLIQRQEDANPTTSLKKLTSVQKMHYQNRKNTRAQNVLHRLETKRLQAAVHAVQTVEILESIDQPGLLETEHEMERTTAVTQTQLQRHMSGGDNKVSVAQNIYDLILPATAPYGLAYDRSGRYALLYGERGHVAILDSAHRSLVTEFHLRERIRDGIFLHNFTLHAIAQKNHVYIYDQNGTEIHCLSEHMDPCHLEFLPYHWLLASIGRKGDLKYQDTSTGQLVSTHRTKLGAPTEMRQNPANAVLHVGHSNGIVTLWSPATSNYLVKMQCHKGAAITALAVDLEGRTMVTGGMDRQIKVWDLRMYKTRLAYFCSAGVPASLDLSQRGLLAVGHAGHVTVWNADAMQSKASAPYMHHQLGPAGDNRAQGPVRTVRFRPFEDVLGIGHGNGISSIVIPGSGEPTLDTFEYHTNPMQDAKQRREAEVRALLDKLSPEMINIDADFVGGMEESDPASRLERLQDLQEAANANPRAPKKQKTKKRGRSKIQTKLRRKSKNIIDQNTLKLREAKEQEQSARQNNGVNNTDGVKSNKEMAPAALERFF